jgi:hypothetical protein
MQEANAQHEGKGAHDEPVARHLLRENMRQHNQQRTCETHRFVVLRDMVPLLKFIQSLAR